MFHMPTTVSLIVDGKEEIKDFGYTKLLVIILKRFTLTNS